MYEEESQLISTVLERLVRESNSKTIFLVDKNGQLISSAGDVAGSTPPPSLP